jgi:hypothetical protein
MKEWTNIVRVPLAFSPPAAESDTNLFMQVTREDLVHFHFWVGQPEHSHVRLGMLHSVVGYYPALLFLHWTRDGFDPLSGVVVLHISPVEVRGTLSPLEGTGLGPGMLDWWGASGQAPLQKFVLFQGFKL